MQFIAFGDFHRGSQKTTHFLSEDFPGVAAIRQYILYRSEIPLLPLERENRPFSIRYLGSGYRDCVRQALRVYSDMSFDSGDLLAGIIAFMFCAIGVFDALRINDAEAR